MRIERRSLLLGLGSIFATPAIVRAASLMPVRALKIAPSISMRSISEYVPSADHIVRLDVLFGRVVVRRANGSWTIVQSSFARGG